MTLILTRASKDYVLQVTDRLVSQTGGKAFDEISNKNILYFFRNGVAALAYTGIAYVGGVTTDQWIVETLTGHTFDRSRKPPAFAGWSVKVRDIGQSMRLLKKALENAPIDPRWATEWRKSPFDVCISGWQSSGKNFRPLIGWLRKPRNSTVIESEYMPRYWHWEREGRSFRFEVIATPDVNLSQLRQEEMTRKLENCDPDKAEEIMVDTVRAASRSIPEVGPHCTSILIAPPAIGGTRIRYLPAGGSSVARVSTSRGAVLDVPAAFTPWIVAPRAVFAPSIKAGTSLVKIGEYPILLGAPTLPGPGLRGLFSSQQRPPSP